MRSGGLLQRELERAGIPTVSISNTPMMTEKVGVSRAVFIQYPFGRLLGDVGDRAGQRAVCGDMVDMIKTAEGPNSYRHLPYEWPEPGEKAKWRPDIPAPAGLKRMREEEEAKKAAAKK
jgi:D-proline reductase (dithiol) PrdB